MGLNTMGGGFETPDEFRLLTVKSIRETNPQSDSVLVDFEDSAVSLQLNKQYLAERGLRNISVGTQLNVKGKNGNSEF